jgi:hypothetical protein
VKERNKVFSKLDIAMDVRNRSARGDLSRADKEDKLVPILPPFLPCNLQFQESQPRKLSKLKHPFDSINQMKLSNMVI